MLSKSCNDQSLSSKIVRHRSSGRIRRFIRICNESFEDSDLALCMTSIFTIESYFRPFLFRLAEYGIVLITGTVSAVFGSSMRNYTIGPCQLGLATICNYYGAQYYQHQPRIKLKNIKCLFQLLSVAFLSSSAKILYYRIFPLFCRAQKIYPDDKERQMYYIGEQYNGRFSYGLMLYEVSRGLEKEFA